MLDTPTIYHTYDPGGVVAISTISNFPSGDNGYVFSIKSIPSPNQFTVHVGPNDREHTYVEGGTVDRNIVDLMMDRLFILMSYIIQLER